MAEWHDLMGGKLHVYKRGDGRYWQCSTYLKGKEWRQSTKQDSLGLAKEFAEDWYLSLRGKDRAGILSTAKPFHVAADQFEREYEVITEGERSPKWVEGHKARLRLHLVPYFGNIALTDITAGTVQEYRMHRVAEAKAAAEARAKAKAEAAAEAAKKSGKPAEPPAKIKLLARSTLHDEVVTLRQVLKTAIRHKWLDHLPDLSPPYKSQGKVVHRPWFSPEEYIALYTATGEYAKKPFHERDRWCAEQVHDYVLFLANTGLRPDEAKNLQHRDVEIVLDEATKKRILEIEVRGKRGVGYCKSMPNAVHPYERLLRRAKPAPRKRVKGNNDKTSGETRFPQPTDPVFPGNHIKLFNGVLRRAKLKLDRDDNRRTAYSLRHTYICMRLMEGADIYQIAKNCRTSVEMIEKFYAAHIKNTLDAAAINVLRAKRRRNTTPDNVAA
ncbi:MAG TPA: hypothetical protein VII56_13110 [Rhizomicrobium sp.]